MKQPNYNLTAKQLAKRMLVPKFKRRWQQEQQKVKELTQRVIDLEIKLAIVHPGLSL